MDQMLEEITWSQFLEWVAFSDLEPFDEARADIRTAHVVTAIANANRDPKKHRASFELRDFVLLFGDTPRPRKEQKTPAQLEAIGKMYAALYGAFDGKES